MPSSSTKQHKFMAAVAHSPDFAKKAGVPMSVGKDFVNADKAQKGTTMATKGKMPPFMGKESKAEEAKEMKMMKKKPAAKYARGGGIEIKGKTKGKMVTMASGGRCK
ncbi:MAG: hypothetical protein EBZ60_08045 [Betaproteobacteria bacterium]|nr:hypothetical protein [Betaproteobacteria bacterium]